MNCEAHGSQAPLRDAEGRDASPWTKVHVYGHFIAMQCGIGAEGAEFSLMVVALPITRAGSGWLLGSASRSFRVRQGVPSGLRMVKVNTAATSCHSVWVVVMV